MSKQKGFTLIELVIVIAVLGILAAIAIPKFIDLEADALSASQKGMSGAVKSAHAIAIADMKRFPTVSELAGYVNGEGVAAAGDDTGINVVIDGGTHKVLTYSDTNCVTPTAVAVPPPGGSGVENVVQCVGNI